MPPFVGWLARLVGEPACSSLLAEKMYKWLGTVFLPALVAGSGTALALALQIQAGPFPPHADVNPPAAVGTAPPDINPLACSNTDILRLISFYNDTFGVVANDELHSKHGEMYAVRMGTQVQDLMLQQEGSQPAQPPGTQVSNPEYTHSWNPRAPPQLPELNMQPGDDRLFLLLGKAAKIYTQYQISWQDVQQSGLKDSYVGHVHLPVQIHDFSPVYGFWCFLSERLNKLLKSFKSNNWGGGQLEICLIAESDNMLESSIAKHLLAKPRASQGTIEAMAADHVETLLDRPVIQTLRVIPNSSPGTMYIATLSDMAAGIQHWLTSALPFAHIQNQYHYETIVSIFEHCQAGYPPTLFVEVSWFQTLDMVSIPINVWAEFPELDIRFHKYRTAADFDPMIAVIPFSSVQCHLARGMLTATKPLQWMTVTLDKETDEPKFTVTASHNLTMTLGFT
ncbi:hypothetical protein JB92DRAFT_2831344 [Gautieria morchelliformis]|nr:hypothetical protein JB92DRAFT_2831344 [Gautieria morchelliformis]